MAAVSDATAHLTNVLSDSLVLLEAEATYPKRITDGFILASKLRPPVNRKSIVSTVSSRSLPVNELIGL